MPLKKTIQPYGTPCNTWAKELMVANTAVFDWTKTCVNGNSNIPFISYITRMYAASNSLSNTRIRHVR